jgi:hypothetical protein
VHAGACVLGVAAVCYTLLYRMDSSTSSSRPSATGPMSSAAKAIRKLWRRGRRPRGRVLAVKLGLNPNSSSLGADVTFLLLGAAALSFLTPVVAALVRLKRPRLDVDATGAEHVEPAAPPA